jgi:hypothetical protein
MSRYLVPLLMVVGLVRTQDSSTNSTGELSLPNPKVCNLHILQSIALWRPEMMCTRGWLGYN